MKSTGDSVTYSLDEMGDMYFDIDSATGQLMTEADLDHETRDSYSVTVTATDTVDLYDMITVTITVTDVNEAPTFDAHTVEPVMLDVDENTAAGENVGDPVMAMDEDEGDTLTYAVGGDDMASFAIDSATGQLMTMAALDYETKSSYSVTVMATDSDGLYDMIAVTITVTNVNDEMPMFADDMAEFSVAENAAAGTEVGMVMATADADDSLMYSDDSMYFDVDPETGQIMVAEGAMLDYEMEDMHMVTVTASDGEGPATPSWSPSRSPTCTPVAGRRAATRPTCTSTTTARPSSTRRTRSAAPSTGPRTWPSLTGTAYRATPCSRRAPAIPCA